ncbi:EPS depolymerase [Xanthomonas phage XaC1]|nr:EPS depolymerase [Xanthomonas phage XaC1]
MDINSDLKVQGNVNVNGTFSVTGNIVGSIELDPQADNALIETNNGYYVAPSQPGAPGKSSYELAQEQGYPGTLSDYIAKETAAGTSAANAKASETNAKTSENNAKTSETNSASSATSASTYASNAKTSETNSKTSETNAKTSETNSASSATAAATSATNAKTSETNSATSATNAQNYYNLTIANSIDSIATLKTMQPTLANPVVAVRGYNAGTNIGGGNFYYVADTSTVEDGGLFFRVDSKGGWRRATPAVDDLDITHFGAMCDGKTDDAAAIIKMHKWSLATGGNFGPGVILPAGSTAVDVVDLGTAEISSFKIRGPERAYGHLVSATLVPFSKTQTTPMFTFCARRMEVSNLRLLGTGTVQPFFKNTVTRGAFARVHSIRTDYIGGRAFQLIDTLDCKFDQIYSYNGNAAFLWVTWSNLSPGSWDHPTAIEISNFNFNSHKNEYAVSAIRAGQSMMYNGWFDHCEYPFDISQGGWTLDNITMENATNPAGIQYSKLVQINCRWEQGKGLDNTVSGYTQDMDLANGGSGNMPSWVTNGYDQGVVEIKPAGAKFDCGISNEFQYSNLILTNSSNAEQWVQVGRICTQGQGSTWKMNILGTNGWDSANSALVRPAGTNFGGGNATIYFESKSPSSQNTTTGEMHWYGEGSCPIKAVKYLHSWGYCTVYVKMGSYTKSAAVFLECNGTSRLQTGNPFWLRADNIIMTEDEVLAVSNIATAVKRWAINSGDYDAPGIGMDLDSGKVVLNSTYVDNAASRHLQVSFYGVDQYIPLQATNQSIRIPVYAYADLPSPSTNVYGMVLCRNTTLAQPLQPLFSNGSTWYLMSDPSNSTWRPTS